MRGLVEGIEAVLPTGRSTRLSGLKKDNRWPSSTNADRGRRNARHRDGRPPPACAGRSSARRRVLGMPTLRPPSPCCVRLRRTEQIEGFEILPAESSMRPGAPPRRPPAAHRKNPWHALVKQPRPLGDDEAPDALLERLVAPLLEQGLVADAAIAANEAQADAFWKIRDGLSEAEKKAFGPATQHDISVPVDAMPRFLREASAAVEAAFPGTRASGFGHLGDGNIHFHVRALGRGGDDWVNQGCWHPAGRDLVTLPADRARRLASVK